MGGISSAALENFSRDVFLYTTRADVREEIDQIVASSLTEQPTVMVGHSLGSVVAYSVLRSDSRSLRVPLYLTLGCPLGIRAIRDQFRPLQYPLPVKEWFNAFDTHDIVALHPLDRANFPVAPEIENYAAVKNSTGNRHGIVGYLDDSRVAQRLLDALGLRILLRKPPLCPAEARDRKENLAFGYFLGAQLFLFVLRSAARKRSELLEVPARLERTSFGSEYCGISYAGSS